MASGGAPETPQAWWGRCSTKCRAQIWHWCCYKAFRSSCKRIHPHDSGSSRHGCRKVSYKHSVPL